MNLGKLGWKGGTSNPVGSGRRFFVAYLEDIKTSPTIPTGDEDGVAAITLPDGDIVMEDGKTFTDFYSTTGYAEITSGAEGATDSQAPVDKFVAHYPDVDDAAVLVFNKLINSNCVIIAPTKVHDKNGYQWCIMGNGMNSPTLANTLGTGKKSGDEKGLNVEATCEVEIGMLRYNGAVKTAEGSYDCETNVFTPNAEI